MPGLPSPNPGEFFFWLIRAPVGGEPPTGFQPPKAACSTIQLPSKDRHSGKPPARWSSIIYYTIFPTIPQGRRLAARSIFERLPVGQLKRCRIDLAVASVSTELLEQRCCEFAR